LTAHRLVGAVLVLLAPAAVCAALAAGATWLASRYLADEAPRALTVGPSPPPPEDFSAARGEPDPAGAPAGPRRGGTLRLPGDEPTVLDPALVRDVVSAEYVVEVFGGLVTLSPALEVVPDLAESWTVDPRGTVYTFTLRAGVTFHDGTPVTAADVAFAVERACDPATGSPVAETYLGDVVGCGRKLAGRSGAVTGVTVIDERRVALAVDAPKAYFLAKLTYPTSFVVDRRQVESDPLWFQRPNGTGPFRLAAYRPGERVRLEPFRGWHGDGPHLDAVELDLRPIDPVTRYENGELDATPVGAADSERVRDPLNPLRFEVVEGPGDLGLTYLGFHTRRAPFDDEAVRRAFAQAVDRRRLTEIVLRGSAYPIETILPPGLKGHVPDANPYRYDPEAARAALAASRYGSARALPPLSLHVAGSGGGSPVAEALVDLLGEVFPGLTITVEQAPWETFQRELDEGIYGMYLLGWAADYPDAQDFLDVLFHSRSPLNDSGFADDQVDRWLEAARVEPHEGRRLRAYAAAERRVLAAAPWVPLYGAVDTWLVAPHVHGFSLPAIVRPRLADVWLDGP